jgi:hypothetical protein
MTTTTVKAFGDWKTNAEMIADVAKLGYLDGRVLDPTWGEGNFWTVFKPKRFVRHDLHTLDGVDVRDLIFFHRRNSFDSIVIDLPYAFRGRATPAFDDKYGVSKYRGANKIMQLIFDAMSSCEPLLRSKKYLLVKCEDQVVSGHVRWQTDEITAYAKTLHLRKVDRFDFANGGREQPKNRTKKCLACNGDGCCARCNFTGRVPSQQQHAGHRPSTLLVFQKVKS